MTVNKSENEEDVEEVESEEFEMKKLMEETPATNDEKSNGVNNPIFDCLDHDFFR